MQFSKMHGLGNDFMVVDAVTQNVFFSPELIRRLADRHVGVGFDQLLVVEPPYDPDLDFHYRIFNADGSEVSQCGNGALFCPLCSAERADQQARYPRQHRQWPDGAQRHRRRTGAREHGRAELRTLCRAVSRQQSGKDLYHACRRADSIVRRRLNG